VLLRTDDVVKIQYTVKYTEKYIVHGFCYTSAAALCLPDEKKLGVIEKKVYGSKKNDVGEFKFRTNELLERFYTVV